MTRWYTGRGWGGLLFLLALLVICGMFMTALYAVTDDDCKRRGGHTEVVWGRGGGWTCSGARP